MTAESKKVKRYVQGQKPHAAMRLPDISVKVIEHK
jgi:hypothetical protein